ncbi:MAG: pantetheine-phosphate adenylyltransferase [Clostridiales bacterium]|nr:pantetheine-phosphate adenylyltransferase [Clostridiales bacterium]
MKAIFPGSFDPITLGHLDLIRRAAAFCDELTVAILINPDKEGAFPLSERLDMVKSACGAFPQVRVASFSGLLVDFARQQGVRLIIRGVRGGTDLENETAMAWANTAMLPELETLFLPASNGLGGVSSSLVRQIARFGGDLSAFVPPEAVETVRARLHDK